MKTFSPRNLHVAILRGGPSSEYDLSLLSGSHALKHLRDIHNTRDIYVDKRGRWHSDGMQKDIGEALAHADLVLNMMHGTYGEDGEVQRVLSSFALPYTGSTASPSALAYHKVQAKNLLSKEGVRSPFHRLVSFDNPETIEDEAYSIFRSMPMPVIIKPIAGGASEGIAIADDFMSLKLALEMSLRHSDAVIVEEYIRGHLVSVSVIDGLRDEEHYTTLPIELRFPVEDMYLDYRNKEKQNILIPRHIPHTHIRKAEKWARDAHRSLGLRHYSRSEFIISPTRGVYFIEINSHPDLSPQSPFMHSLKESGVPNDAFFTHLINISQKTRP